MTRLFRGDALTLKAYQLEDQRAGGRKPSMPELIHQAVLRDYMLPVDSVAMRSALSKALKADRPHVGKAEFERMFTMEHARDVAWRVIRDWLEAQLAIIAAQMAVLDQVMLPYLEVSQGESLYGRYVAMQGQIALEAGS